MISSAAARDVSIFRGVSTDGFIALESGGRKGPGRTSGLLTKIEVALWESRIPSVAPVPHAVALPLMSVILAEAGTQSIPAGRDNPRPGLPLFGAPYWIAFVGFTELRCRHRRVPARRGWQAASADGRGTRLTCPLSTDRAFRSRPTVGCRSTLPRESAVHRVSSPIHRRVGRVARRAGGTSGGFTRLITPAAAHWQPVRCARRAPPRHRWSPSAPSVLSCHPAPGR